MPPLLQYGDSLTEDAPSTFYPREVILEEFVPLGEVDAGCDPRYGTVTIQHESEGRHRIVFSPHPDLRSGPLSTAIALHAVTTTGDRLPAYSIAVVGKIMPNIRPVPDRLEFGAGLPGTVAECSVVLQSMAGKPFEVLDTRVVQGPERKENLSIIGFDSARAISHAIRIRYIFPPAGHQLCQIRADVRNDAGRRQSFFIVVSGFAEPQE